MAVPALTSTPSLLQGEDSTGRVSRGSGAQSAAGAGSGKEGLGGGPVSLLGRGHTLRGSQGPTACGHSCPARTDSPAFTPREARARTRAREEAGRCAVLCKGGSWSARTEESKKRRLTASGRRENTAEARQAQRHPPAKWLLRWACAPPGQGRVGGSPCLEAKLQTGLGGYEAAVAWTVQPGGLVWTLALWRD